MVRSFLGNFGMMVRAYAYIRELGADGLLEVSNMAVLNANYVAARLRDHISLAYNTPCCTKPCSPIARSKQKPPSRR